MVFPIVFLFDYCGQCVVPILFSKYDFLSCRTPTEHHSLGTIDTVTAILTSSFCFSFLKSSLKLKFSLPPWTVLESHKTKSPASHSTSSRFPINGSLPFSSSQSEVLCSTCGYRLIIYESTYSEFDFGTTWRPPTSFFLTLLSGIIAWTHLSPFLWKGFWSRCKFST